MDPGEKPKRRLRWPFCGSSAGFDEGENSSPRVAQIPEARYQPEDRESSSSTATTTRQSTDRECNMPTNSDGTISTAVNNATTTKDGKMIQTKSPNSWRSASKRVGKILRLTSTPRSNHKEDDIRSNDSITCGSKGIQSTKEIIPDCFSREITPTKWPDRSRTMPTRLLVDSGKVHLEQSGNSLDIDCELESDNLLPRVQSVMTPRKVLPPTRGKKTTQKRRASLRAGSLMHSTIDEEDEMVGFECIDTMGNNLILPSGVAASTASMGILPMSRSPKYQSRQDRSASRSVYDNRRETTSGMQRAASTRTSKLALPRELPAGTLKSSRELAPRKRYEMGSFDTFISSFTYSPESSSAFDPAHSHISKLERVLDHRRSKRNKARNKSVQQKPASGAPLNGFAFFYSHSAYFSSSASSSSTSCEEEEEDDDLDSYSMASNSTISTRASEANLVWGNNMVMFEPSMIDAGRDSDSE